MRISAGSQAHLRAKRCASQGETMRIVFEKVCELMTNDKNDNAFHRLYTK